MNSTNGTAGSLVHALSYRRVSGAEHQKKGLSLDFQARTLAGYVAGQSRWLNHAEYQDVLSGARDDRPGYQAMLDEARRLRRDGQAVAVVALRLDRFGRDLAEASRARKELRKLGVEIHATAQGGNMDSTLVAGMHMVMSEHERELIAARVKDTRDLLVEDGHYYGRVAFGYRFREGLSDEAEARVLATGGSRVFEPDPVTADVARSVFERIAAGETVRSVSRWLSSLPAELRGNRSWPHQSVTKMIRSATYVARAAVGSEDVLSRPLARWQPLVSDERWQACQDKLADHAVRPHEGANSRFLLTGWLRCDVCGERMVATSNRQGGRRRSYRCTGALKGANAPVPGCNRLVSMTKLDDAVCSVLADVLAKAADPGKLSAAWQRLSQPVSVDVSRVRELQSQVSKLNARLASAAAKFADGDLDRRGYDAMRDAAVREIEAAESELARLDVKRPAGLPALDTVLASLGTWANIIALADTEAVRDVLRLLVQSVTPVRVGFGKYEASITWTELGQALVG